MGSRIGALGICLAFTLLSACKAAPGPARPNVLLISLDALRADRLGCYGNERETSPFLDELAAGGVRFLRAFSNCNATDCSHTTMLSSQYQETHGVSMYTSPELTDENRIKAIPEGLPLVQETLRQQGYATVGVSGGGWVARDMGFDRGFDEFDDGLEDIREATARLLELIGRHSGEGKPTFAFLHTYEVHSPYEPPGEYRTMFGRYESTIQTTSEYLTHVCPEAAARFTETDWEFLRAMYDGEIRYTDDTLRKLFADLRASGFLDDALVIVTSDHGEEFGEHGECLHGERLYEELLHVPLILFGNAVPPGETIERLVSTVDIVPTILAYAKIDVDLPLAGHDLLAPSPKTEAEEFVVAQMGPWAYAVRSRNWKLIEWKHPTASVELYDMTHDPRETTNLAEQLPEQTAAMRSLLALWKGGLVAPTWQTREAEMSPEQRERLKSLGYVN